MLKKRVIFTLLYDNGSFVLSRNFRLQKVGDLSWLRQNYNFSKVAFSIDELIVLDVTRGERDEKKFYEHVRSLTEECFVPIAAGGGIRMLEQARELIRSGADKVVLNTLIYKSPETVREIAAEFGEQCLIAAVDIRKTDVEYRAWVCNGSEQIESEVLEYVEKIIHLPIGEIYLNSIDRDGTGQGYLVELLDQLPGHIQTPVILAGGAGNSRHLADGLGDQRVDAVATAHLFNFVGDGLEQARRELIAADYNLATWDIDVAADLRNSIDVDS
jgi:imidazole glycerol-phosphate synthase subunit HisF